jgi:peptidoglycan/xylan/chitin deacetylase (PgdA/CDA1 family)
MSLSIGDKARFAARRMRNTFVSRGVILLYHRVIDLESDPYNLCISPARFEEHLQVLRRLSPVVRLGELAKALSSGSLPHRSVVITFDDGYADNLYQAQPLLEKYEIPATVFMTTGAGGRQREFWWDELVRIFLQPNSLPQYLNLDVTGLQFTADLAETATYNSQDFRHHARWSIKSADNPTARHRVFRALYPLLSKMRPQQRTQALDQLLQWASFAPTVRPTHRALEPAEVRELAKGGVVEIGGHTVNHPDLTAQSAEVQADEIGRCREDLERILERAVSSFAYPFGFYDELTPRIVREAGFQCACSCEQRVVRGSSDLLLLPRFSPGNWDGRQFAEQIRGWLC